MLKLSEEKKTKKKKKKLGFLHLKNKFIYLQENASPMALSQ